MARSSRDDAADASRFFARVGYAAVAIGAPVAVVIHPLALFIVFPIGVAMIVLAAALEGRPGFGARALRAFTTPTFLALAAGFAWATLSILWTPYPVSALQHCLKLGLLILATLLAVAAPRDNARATDLYMFPIGVVLGMIAMSAKGLAGVVGAVPDDGEFAAGGVALAVLLFPALGGLTARGRNGYARLLLIIALAFAYIAGYAPLTIALFAGYLALSFAISDLTRSVREFAWGAAALILLSPLIPAFAPTIAAWVFNVKLASLPPPYASLSIAADIFTHDKLRLLTGHGFATVSRGVHDLIAALYPAFARLHGLVRTRNRGRGHRRGRRLVRLSRSRQSPAPPRAVYGRRLRRARRAGVFKRRFRRHDRPDPGRRRGHCDRRRRTQPVPHHASLRGEPRDL